MENKQSTGRNALVLALIVLAIIALAALAVGAHSTRYFPIDLTIARDVQAFHPVWFDLLMRAVGQVGYPPQVYLVVAWIIFLLFVSGYKWEAIAQTFATVGIGVVGLAIKIPVNRPRPSPELIYVANPSLDGGKFSFTAGHVESFVAIFGFLMFLIYLYGRPGLVRTFTLCFFAFLISFIGLSRIYVGEHWFSDVVGGYLLGGLWLAATIYFYNWGKSRFFVHERGRPERAASARP